MENKTAEEVLNDYGLINDKDVIQAMKEYAQLESKEWDMWKADNGWQYHEVNKYYVRNLNNKIEKLSFTDLYTQYLTDKNK